MIYPSSDLLPFQVIFGSYLSLQVFHLSASFPQLQRNLVELFKLFFKSNIFIAQGVHLEKKEID